MIKNKRKNMNIVKKIGLSALAGSLAAVSAYAGEVAVTGNLDATYTTKHADGGSMAATDEGKGFSTHTGITFTASGEADNGWTMSGFITQLQDFTGISSSQMSVTMGSMGKLQFNHVGGGAVNSLDDKLPTAWEESWDNASHSFSGEAIGTGNDDGGISYHLPQFEYEGNTVDIGVDYDPAAGVAAGGAGSTQVTTTYGAGTGVAVKVGTAMGLSFFAGAEEAERQVKSALLSDSFNATIGGSYAYSNVTLGVQGWSNDPGNLDGIAYESIGYSVAVAVNDNLSISYAAITDEKKANIDGTGNVEADLDAFNVAYSMGSMAVKAQHSRVDNQDHVLKGSAERTEISLSLAF